MRPHVDTVALELAALTQRFLDLGAKLGEAAPALVPGLPERRPDPEPRLTALAEAPRPRQGDPRKVRRVLIIGATSAIAHETARRFADRGDALFLVARNQDRLRSVAEDLRGRGAGRVETLVMDALDYDRHDGLVTLASERLSGIDVALIAHGTLPDQKACEATFDETRRELEINALSVISLLTRLGNYFEKRKQGTVVVFSSVAGDRGRQSNYVYGTAKAALTTFLQGLRNRLHRSGVHVITLKIGRVDTPMTVDFKKNASWAHADRVARGICRAIDRGADVAYVPWFWRIIMMAIRAIPERLFKRLEM